VIAFIDAHRSRFGGVAPICRVLSQHGVRVAPRTYYAVKSRTPSKRCARDAELVELIRSVHADRAKGRGLPGTGRCGICCAGTALRLPGARWPG